MFDLKKWLKNQGYEAADDTQTRQMIPTWLAWYQGYVKGLHDYRYYNGVEYIQARKATLGMAKLVCEDWANLLLNERVQVSVDDGWSERLQEILTAQKWWMKANQTVELAFAMGTGAFVQYADEHKQPAVDCYRADMIYPLSWDSSGVKECAFASVCTMDGKKAVYVMIHALENRQYVIRNHWFEYDSGKELESPENTMPVVQTGSFEPLFQLITPNIVNSVDMDSPMGISVFANSMDVLAEVDDIFDSLDNEFRLGRKRVLLPMSMAKIQMMGETDKDGKPVMRPAFDHQDTVFYAYETDPNNPKNAPIELNMELRVEQHKTALLSALALLGKKCGVGADRYTWDKQGGLRTATEVVSDKSDLYQNMRKHELGLQAAIIGMVKALAYIDSIELQEVKVNFDDSIIQDSQAELDNAIAKLTNGLISHKTIMTDVFDMTEQDADAELQRIRNEQKVQMPAVDFLNAGTDDDVDTEDDEEEQEDAEV